MSHRVRCYTAKSKTLSARFNNIATPHKNQVSQRTRYRIELAINWKFIVLGIKLGLQ